MATANTGKSLSRDKVAFWPIKYLHLGVHSITSPNTHHPTILRSYVIKSNSAHTHMLDGGNKTLNEDFCNRNEQSVYFISVSDPGQASMKGLSQN